MQNEPEILYWRRTDVPGLERLTLSVSADAVWADSTVICLEDGGFRLDHKWKLTPDWRALSLNVERWGPGGHHRIILERTDGGLEPRRRATSRPRRSGGAGPLGNSLLQHLADPTDVRGTGDKPHDRHVLRGRCGYDGGEFVPVSDMTV